MFDRFFHSEVSGSVVLMTCSIIALAWANSAARERPRTGREHAMPNERARQRTHAGAAAGYRSAVQLILAALLVLVTACAKPPRWISPDKPSPEHAAVLLEGEILDAMARDPLPSEVPEIPIRKRLRPCCAFGNDLRVRVGAVPVPGFRIGNIMGIDEVGPHTYDSGAMTRSSQAGTSGFRHRESNGLIYTCRGGFIDTAHVRDYVDWSIYLAAELARNLSTGVTVELPDEGGQRRIVAQLVSQDLIDRHGLTRVTIRLAEWISFQLSVWHEIATWFGWSWVKTFPETASAFSPEDLYSNILGVKIAEAIVHRRSGRTEDVYNRSVDTWLALVLEHLGPVPKSVGVEAMRSVDKHWWDSSRRLPDKELTLRRHMDIDDSIAPWLVPSAWAPESLREICGDDPDPVAIANTDGVLRIQFSDWVSLQIEVDDNLAAQVPFTEIGRTVTQADFPRIIEAIREQNREEFGPDADQPD
jgi:hypothetical protein